jgi:hypothetical protein
LKKIEFRNYRSCGITGIKNGDWKLIGKINLEENNIQYPKLIIFENWRQKFSLNECRGGDFSWEVNKNKQGRIHELIRKRIYL